MNKEQKKAVEQTKAMIFKSLDGVYKSCKQSADSFQSDVIPVAFLKGVIDTLKTEFTKELNKLVK